MKSLYDDQRYVSTVRLFVPEYVLQHIPFAKQVITECECIKISLQSVSDCSRTPPPY